MQIAIHLQCSERDVGAIEKVQNLEQEKERKQAHADFAHCFLFDRSFVLDGIHCDAASLAERALS
jgi:hypothetical protein